MANRTMRAITLSFIFIAIIVIAAAAYYYGRVVPLIRAGKREGIYSSESARPSVAAFGFETENGAHQSLADLKGNVVVVDVWATWCGTCLYNIPKVIALANKYADKPVKIIGLDVDDDGWEKVKPFLRTHPEMKI